MSPKSRETVDCWFDEPTPGDRQSWVIPPGHGTYRRLDLELLDPGDEDQLMLLLEAMHADDDYGPGSTEDDLSDDVHMIAELVVHDVYGVLADNRHHDSADYARRLAQLPGAWPPPEALR